MKCCANCEWSISPELEDEILEEQGYEEDDPNRTHAGDCCIGMKPDKHYYCPSHQYIEGMEEYENIVLYDEQYLGAGYLIISKLDDEVIKFIKISSFGEGGFPSFSIRGFEKGSNDIPEEEYRKINISVNREEPLYEIIHNLANWLNNKCIYSIDTIEQGKNNLHAEYSLDEAILTLEKDIFGVKHATDFIDILLGDNHSCKSYSAILNFYNELSEISIGKTTEKDIQKIIKK